MPDFQAAVVVNRRVEAYVHGPIKFHAPAGSISTTEQCKDIVDQLNAEAFEIRGRVDSLDIVSYDGVRVWPVERFSLAGTEDP